MSLAVAQDARIKDWRWRLNHLYKIADKHGQLVTFKENAIQKQINNCRRRKKRILKARQFGVTTNESLKQLDFVSFSSNKTAVLMADKDDNMEKIFSKVRFAHSKMPARFRPALPKGTAGSKFELTFPEINSKIYCALEGRGDTIHWLHISEAAFAKPERLKATLGAVPPWGVVTWETTPNGLGNHFARDWMNKQNTVQNLFFPWFFHHEYQLDGHGITLTDEERRFVASVKKTYNINVTLDQIAFRRAKQEEQRELFIQEYPEDDVSCFLASGEAAMDLQIIKRLLDKVPEPIEDTGELKIWKHYDSSRIYACGADTAEGVGGDYSVASMFDVQTREQVAQLRSNRWRPREFAIQVNALCSQYYKQGRVAPLLGVERNNHGHAVLLELQEHLAYPNLYFYKEDDDAAAGWKTDAVTRPLMVDAFIDGVENETVVLNSRETLGECLTLIDNNGKIEAEDGENDDCVIADSIGIQMCIKASGSLSLYENIRDKILL